MNENAFCGFRPKVLSLDSKTYSEERNAIQSIAFATGGGLVVVVAHRRRRKRREPSVQIGRYSGRGPRDVLYDTGDDGLYLL